MPQSLSAINWTITPCNYYPSAIFRRWMLMNEAYYVSLEPSLRSMYSLSRRWSIAFLISGTFGVNLVLGSAWPIPLLQDSLQRSVRWPLESMLDAWESTNQPCPLAPLWWTHLSTLHQSHDRSLINESSVLLYRLQHLCSLHLELRSSGHIEVDLDLVFGFEVWRSVVTLTSTEVLTEVEIICIAILYQDLHFDHR